MHQNSKSNPIDTQSCLNGSIPYGYQNDTLAEIDQEQLVVSFQ
ncbi:MAG: hypothetical protein P1P78_05825 [Methyloprofundus sp.]|nr:hypothetical protein [Methyloprofundus sp.]